MADTKARSYEPTTIEKKWRQRWEVEKLYDSNIDPSTGEVLRADHAALSLG